MVVNSRHVPVVVTILVLLSCAAVHAGQGESVQYRVVCRAVGAGQIVIDPNSGVFDSGGTVTLTAEPNDGWSFVRWAGDANSVRNPVEVTARSNLMTVAIFTQNDPNARAADQPVGFAGVSYQGLAVTTGGAGGDVVVVTTGQQLKDVLLARKDSRFNKNYPPLNIIVLGKLTFSGSEMVDVKETYNVSIVGAGSDAAIEGFGLNIYKSYNIIVRNIEFRSCPDDAINVCDPITHHVWIDHCTLSDWPDVDPGGARHELVRQHDFPPPARAVRRVSRLQQLLRWQPGWNGLWHRVDDGSGCRRGGELLPAGAASDVLRIREFGPGRSC
jgi:hypothetical protein